ADRAARARAADGRDRAAARPGPARDRADRRAAEPREAPEDHDEGGRGDPNARTRDLRARRHGVRDRLAAAARRGALREARALEEATRQDRLLDRRARAASDPRGARDRAEGRALA